MEKRNWSRSGNRYRTLSNRQGKIVVLAAPSGAGKTTMTRRLLSDFDKLRFSISATTRPPRPGETDGIDYHFLSAGEFQEKIDREEFLEWEEFYNGTRYGTLRSDIENQRKKGYFVLLDVDVLGALNVKQMYGDDVLGIFIAPPSMETLKERLEQRGTESEETLNTRLDRAREEMTYMSRFDMAVVNDDLDDAYRDISAAVKKFMKL